MAEAYDVVVIGSGPGGYVAAIKAAQLGKKTALIERESLGGVCLNWGCIPTKALIKSAEVFEQLKHAADYGLSATGVKADFDAVIKRSRGVADKMSQGIQFLMKKNKVSVIMGHAKLLAPGHILVEQDGRETFVDAKDIIIATGAQARTFPNLPIDDERVFHYRRAMYLPKQPKSMMCIGAGAIGMEFGYFYNAMGTAVHVVEMMDQVLPIEDAETAKFVERSFTKAGVTIHTGTKVKSLKVKKKSVTVTLVTGDGDQAREEQIDVECVLVAVGMVANTAEVGLENAGVELDERGFIKVDAQMRTNVSGIYAIGDVTGRQLLAHKASAEAEAAAAAIAGHREPVDYSQVPGCTYCQPQVASVGVTERAAKKQGIAYKVGKFNFQASGKATAIGHPEGFIKLLFDQAHDQLIGAHIVGHDATELLAELGLALKLECTAKEILATVHAHPTLSEGVMEAAADALGICVHQ